MSIDEFMVDCRDIRRTIGYIEVLMAENENAIHLMGDVGVLAIDTIDAFLKDIRNLCFESLLEAQLESWNHGA